MAVLQRVSVATVVKQVCGITSRGRRSCIICRRRSATSRTTSYLKFEYIILYECTHPVGAIQHLSAAPRNGSGILLRHLHSYILNCHLFVSNRC